VRNLEVNGRREERDRRAPTRKTDVLLKNELIPIKGSRATRERSPK
jgi:hypothetical protein